MNIHKLPEKVGYKMEMIERLPKVDLHIHLDGSVRPETIRELALAEGILLPRQDPDGLRQCLQVQEDCRNLPDYLSKFDLPIACMQSVPALRRIAREIVEDASAHQVKYIEVRFAPRLHIMKGLSVEEAIAAVLSGLEEGERAFGTKARAIIICMRSHTPSANEDVVHTARAFLGKGVVGIDLAGDEVHYPPEVHRDVFRLADRFGFPVTIHAGEAAGAENIRESITHMSAQRIGHGVRLKDDPELLRHLIGKQIPLEMCVTSNVQTRAVPGWKSHPIKSYYDQGVIVTLNTDNTTVSHTDITKEISRVMEHFHFTVHDIAVLTLNAVKVSFLETGEKNQVLQEFRTAFQSLGIHV